MCLKPAFFRLFVQFALCVTVSSILHPAIPPGMPMVRSVSFAIIPYNNRERKAPGLALQLFPITYFVSLPSVFEAVICFWFFLAVPICFRLFLDVLICFCSSLDVAICSCFFLEVPICFCSSLEVAICSCLFLEVPICFCSSLDVAICSCFFLEVPKRG